MLAREYDKQIKVYEVTNVPNEFGGNTIAETLVTTTWAKLITNGLGNKAVNMGITTFENALLFKVRHRLDFTYQGRTLFIMYRGDKYIIKAVRDVNERQREVEIFCTKEEPISYE